MRKRRKSKTYRGKLAIPSAPTPEAPPVRVPGIPGEPEQLRKRRSVRGAVRTLAHEHEGLELLCRHYGIDDRRYGALLWYELAVRLARDHVPYFRARPRRGPRPTWFGARLVVDLALTRADAGDISEAAALEKLCRSQAYVGSDPESLGRRLRDLRRKDQLVKGVEAMCRLAEPLEPTKRREALLELRKSFTTP